MTAGMMSPWLHSTVSSGSAASSSTTASGSAALGQHVHLLHRQPELGGEGLDRLDAAHVGARQDAGHGLARPAPA